MKFKIVYDSPGRLRLRCGKDVFPRECEESLAEAVSQCEGVLSVRATSVNGGILIYYSGDSKRMILEAVSGIKAAELEKRQLTDMQQLDDSFKRSLIKILVRRTAMKLFMPSFLALPVTLLRAIPYIKKALSSLWRGKLTVDVLDAVSISAAIAGGSYSTASSVMTLLKISALLEDYTRSRTKSTLSESLAVNIDKVWKITDGCVESVPASSVIVGDVIRIGQGSMIPVDGEVTDGEAGVNEAAMTGEALPQHKCKGSVVYAGTVVEEGSIDVKISQLPDESRIGKVVELIENSENLKSQAQTNAERFADSLVPVSLAVSVLTYLFTRNVSKALSVLMVDYSCAIKLSTPICVISAMREAANRSIMVKGGRFLENFALADTIIFDKTGTLTVSCPNLCRIIAFDGYSEDEVLKISACLEEHFPHSVAKAVVRAAELKGIKHREEHAEVEYIVAHGIASQLHGKRALIGSAHFLFDDENVRVTDEQSRIISELGAEYSLIYLAIGEKLAGILCIEDPIRIEAAGVIADLKRRGFKRVLMITGDGEETARSVSEKLGIDRYCARVLPEDKLNIVNAIKEKGRKVVMVGDGINDSPALAAADVSVAMKDASDIARETADITLLSSSLDRLSVLREMSERLFERIRRNYSFITLFNSGLLALGIAGIIAPAASALLHNMSTMAICASSMRPFLKNDGNDGK